MLYFNRTDASKGIEINKTRASKDCDICHYWYFVNYSFKFQANFWNSCQDLLVMSKNLNNIAILNIKEFDYLDYCCIISLISKNEAINLVQNADLTKKARTL